MNDLNTISRLNAQAVARDTGALRAAGNYVVIEKSGLSVVGVEHFNGAGASERAEARLHEINTSGPSASGEILPPTGPASTDTGESATWAGAETEPQAA
jgi:hypothetical protein